jgi:cardiolipin synthase
MVKARAGAAGARALLAGALMLLAACAALPETGPAVAESPGPEITTAHESFEFKTLGLATPPPAEPEGSGANFVEKSVAAFKALIVKPVLRPVSSLKRLLFLAVDVSVDTVKPVSLLLEPVGPVPPVAQRPGMDLGHWERKLDRLTGTRTSRGSIQFLIGGEQFFPRFVEAVMGARQSVHLRSYIFDSDDYATAMADLLKQRSEKVEVKVLLDGLGSLVAAGVHPESMPPGFDPPESMIRYLERDSEVEVRTQANPWFAGDHAKTFIVDRETAFVGGMNIGREYRHDWHDLMMEVRGPVVAELGRGFDTAWARAGLFGDLAALAQALRPRQTVEAAGGHPVRVLETKPGNPQIYLAQLAAIKAARRSIYIHNPYFSDDEVLVELIRARRRGVDVRVVLSTRGDSPMMDRSNILAANAMFRRGIRVYLYPGFSHVKAAIYDGWACLGSANLDRLSLRINREVNLATSHAETVRALERRLFEADFQTATEMTRPLEENWTYYLAELLSDQL